MNASGPDHCSAEGIAVFRDRCSEISELKFRIAERLCENSRVSGAKLDIAWSALSFFALVGFRVRYVAMAFSRVGIPRIWMTRFML